MVRNARSGLDPQTKKPYEAVSAWVCFLQPETSLEAELVAHMPPQVLLSSTEIVLRSIRANEDTPPNTWRCPPRKLSEKEFSSELSAWKVKRAGIRDLIRDLTPTDSDFYYSLLANHPADAGDLGLPADEIFRLQRTRIESHLYSQTGPRPVRDVPGILFELGDDIVTATLADHSPIPTNLHKGLVPYVVPELFIHILFGIRAVLLALLDSAGVLCHLPSGLPDPDYIGLSPPSCVWSAMDLMRKWEIEDFVPNCKYWKDYPLASCLANPLPKVPAEWSKHGLLPGDSLFSGNLGRFMRRICQPLSLDLPVSADLFRAAFTIAQSKKGFHPVPESFVCEAYAKHANRLSKKPAPLTTEVRTRLRAFCRTLLRGFHPKGLIAQVGHYEGSTRASTTHNRLAGGSRSAVQDDIFTNCIGPLNYEELREVQFDGLVRMVPTLNGIVEERGLLPPTPREWIQMINSPPRMFRHIELLNNRTQEKIDENPALHDKPVAKVTAITEPLKVRTITAMGAMSSYFAKPLQKALWQYLKAFPCFHLISRMVSQNDLQNLCARHTAFFDKPENDDIEWDFVSGDYSAATDNLHIEATKILLEEVKAKVDLVDHPLFPHWDEILLEQVLSYPDFTRIDPVLQENGQLMGSILSFPFLCILNLFTFFESLPNLQQTQILSGKIKIQSLPVLVNGDDIAFRANPEMVSRWKASAASIGFELSLGKNFIHPRFFTINSQPFEYTSGLRFYPAPLKYSNLDSQKGLSWIDDIEAPLHDPFLSRIVRSVDTVRMMGCLNVGLLIGLSKTSKGVQEDSVPLSGWFDGAVMQSMYPTKMANFFLGYHAAEIKRQTQFGSRTLNIYAHPYLGGLGFPVPDGVVPFYTEHQRALAAHLLKAAQIEYFGPPSLHPLKPFAFLTLTGSPATMSIGNVPGNVYTKLGNPYGPYLENQAVFEDNSAIRSTPLSQVYQELDSSVLKPSCRLSNSELKRLLKTANHHRSELIPVKDMETFPFRVICYIPETTIPEIDSKTIPDEEFSLPDQPPALVSSHLTQESLELWEIPTYPFHASLLSTPDPLSTLLPLAVRLRRELKLEKKSSRLQTRTLRFSEEAPNHVKRAWRNYTKGG